MVGYREAGISLFDACSGKEKGLIQYESDPSKALEYQQINKLVVSEEQSLIIAGMEDN